MNYTCPYCNRPTTITEPHNATSWEPINIAATHLDFKKRLGIEYLAIACPSKDCKKLSLTVGITEAKLSSRWYRGSGIQSWQLLPESSAKPQPDYIPKAITVDYYEACRILSLSSKASATLARRALQGMIRDFWGVSKNRLADEIKELESKVSSDTWASIDAVRKVGNIGAHMEKDVNLIIDIDPQEAKLLIELLEDLFVDWYVTRHERQERSLKLQRLAEAKSAAKN